MSNPPPPSFVHVVCTYPLMTDMGIFAFYAILEKSPSENEATILFYHFGIHLHSNSYSKTNYLEI